MPQISSEKPEASQLPLAASVAATDAAAPSAVRVEPKWPEVTAAYSVGRGSRPCGVRCVVARAASGRKSRRFVGSASSRKKGLAISFFISLLLSVRLIACRSRAIQVLAVGLFQTPLSSTQSASESTRGEKSGRQTQPPIIRARRSGAQSKGWQELLLSSAQKLRANKQQHSLRLQLAAIANLQTALCQFCSTLRGALEAS